MHERSTDEKSNFRNRVISIKKKFFYDQIIKFVKTVWIKTKTTNKSKKFFERKK